MQNFEVTVKIVSFLFGVIGSLLLFGGGLISYIYRRHVQENDKANERNRQDHIRIHERIDGIKEKK